MAQFQFPARPVTNLNGVVLFASHPSMGFFQNPEETITIATTFLSLEEVVSAIEFLINNKVFISVNCQRKPMKIAGWMLKSRSIPS